MNIAVFRKKVLEKSNPVIQCGSVAAVNTVHSKAKIEASTGGILSEEGREAGSGARYRGTPGKQLPRSRLKSPGYGGRTVSAVLPRPRAHWNSFLKLAISSGSILSSNQSRLMMCSSPWTRARPAY